jgi:hypothetical protein
MDTEYHINLVRRDPNSVKKVQSKSRYVRTPNDLVLIQQAEKLYPGVRSAMLDLVKDGDYEKYISSINAYDAFYWEQAHKGDQSNIYAYPKIKIGPSWTEQIWAPVFERVRLRLIEHWTHTENNICLLQNTTVVENVSKGGNIGNKDVDGGVAIKVDINGKTYRMPMVVAEMKGGHMCKTITTQVDAIVRRFKNMNPHVLAFAITDNQASTGKKVLIDTVFGSGGILVIQRGQNHVRETHPKLNPKIFKMVEDVSVNYLKTKTLINFNAVKPKDHGKVFLRECIDNDGYYIPNDLKQFM